MNAFRLTEKVRQLIVEAEQISERKNQSSLQSVDFFLGAANVKEGTLLEMFNLMDGRIEEFVNLERTEEVVYGDAIWPFRLPLSVQSFEIWQEAIAIMKRYNQTYLNEGHILKAFFQFAEKDAVLSSRLYTLPYEQLYKTVTSARDLSVYLMDHDWDVDDLPSVVTRQADMDDREMVVTFVIDKFGDEWGRTIGNGFHPVHEGVPIFIAEQDDQLVGFAAFDVYRQKKAIYGPMGVIPGVRETGIGKNLLFSALNEMKKRGYMYVILKEAGPIEFYEKACSAKLIPL
ncbi:GNAT family N-acetyltransferase [Rossellomorea oryzaecorticis]|uniref:GNAT family N-acetyltransferase n=1 Tax=Rossellomorea oryzaecorticis TaxID=1396505 RepID=A0ABU9KDC6_9BACI